LKKDQKSPIEAKSLKKSDVKLVKGSLKGIKMADDSDDEPKKIQIVDGDYNRAAQSLK